MNNVMKYIRNVDDIISPTMHHSFRPPLSDLKSQKYQNSSLFHQLLRSEIEQIRPKSMRLLGEVISSTFLIFSVLTAIVLIPWSLNVAYAYETAPRISDREIIEALVELKQGPKKYEPTI